MWRGIFRMSASQFTVNDARITVEARTDTQLTRLKIERLPPIDEELLGE